MKYLTVVKYDPTWPTLFEQLRDRISKATGDIAVAIEHVGSTAVPGLSAKPVIDMDVVVKGAPGGATAIERLATLGYRHRGNLGIEGREAFDNPPDSPAHHLYVCPHGNLALRNHLAIRDHLRSDPEGAKSYGELKQTLAREYVNDIDGYIDGKTDFLANILSVCGMTDTELESIARANRRD
ncbi:GrpB family protein [Fuerstiella marisgermanici]|uniref:Dephospho-CoA kinase/protein folding accessory domain-containing protein n=1 Tax=Fuerstiella marisgermanici TaxID=1891926 RepID=A0A1P8WRI7_9PLAN|nr:GrpB family protein [Fuerstiella marisgermanici]APZ96665.1 dephospho-CoA kinase/protein folding accessory domain-containing protein [Fuerstiella marisgermanici]